MTNTTRQFWRLAKLPLAVSLASTLASPAFAVNFNIGEIEGQFDSSLSVGASWSTASPDKNLIGKNNGGDGLSQTSDDGHLNFKKGETFSKIFKGIHDLELRYGDTGVFVRGKYWYDFELKDEGREFKEISDSNRKEGAKSSGAELLDAFVYHNYSIADQPGSVRLGKQVVSWGESTFILNSINSINPIDVAAFRRPGAEVKEGLIPVNMFYVSQSLTNNLSAEAFYQLEWDQTVVDNCGTFFSQADIVADGCNNNLAVLNPAVAAFGRGAIPGIRYDATSEGIIVPRSGDRDARDSGQWGAALRYQFEPLDTEFGAYFMNYHSRNPVFSAAAGPRSLYNATAGAAATVQGACAGVPGATAASVAACTQGVLFSNIAGGSNYFIEYPEDIQLYGLSFATTLPTGTAWSGELSYRPNAPVQINTTDILYAGVRGLAGYSGIPGLGGLAAANNLSLLGGPAAGVPGSTVHGYNRKEITQFQTTLTHFFDQVMGASRLTVIGEVGITHVGGLENSSEVRYGRDPVYGPGPLPNGACPVINGAGKNQSKYCKDDGFVTSTSWGYRARAIWEYPDVFAGVNLKPNVAWSHDVNGYGPNGLFNEGAKAVSLGLDAEYQNTYTTSLGYTNFFGGEYNTLVDRDFLALSFGMNF